MHATGNEACPVVHEENEEEEWAAPLGRTCQEQVAFHSHPLRTRRYAGRAAVECRTGREQEATEQDRQLHGRRRYKFHGGLRLGLGYTAATA